MARLSREEVLMEHAKVAALRATCSRQSVGVVIAHDGRVLVSGYNGAPAGMPHCFHDRDEPCEISVHAEANAIAYAARYGIKVEGAELYTTFSPCLACGQLVINAGITRVFYGAYHRDQRGLELIRMAGIETVHFFVPEVI